MARPRNDGTPSKHGGGRTPGALTKMTRDRAQRLAMDGETPLDVMIQNMLFWHRSAVNLGARIERFMETVDAKAPDYQDKLEGFKDLVKNCLAAKDNAQRCAVDAAPYVHPKLQSIHLVKKETKTNITMTLSSGPVEEDRSYRNGPVVDAKPGPAVNGAANGHAEPARRDAN